MSYERKGMEGETAMGVTATTSTGCWPGKGTLRPGVDPSRMSGWVTSVKFTGDLDRETSMQLYAVCFLLPPFSVQTPPKFLSCRRLTSRRGTQSP